MKASEQAGHAIDFLRIAKDIEQGGYESIKGRDLSKDELEVRDSALTALLRYFESEPDERDTKPEGAQATSPTPIHQGP